MSDVLIYEIKAFDWQGAVYPGSLSFWLADNSRPAHLDQVEPFVAPANPTPVTFDAFSLAGTLTIESLGLSEIGLRGIEFVSPMGPPLCMLLVATDDDSGVSLSLFPGDPAFQTVEGPLNISQQVWTLIGQR